MTTEQLPPVPDGYVRMSRPLVGEGTDEDPIRPDLPDHAVYQVVASDPFNCVVDVHTNPDVLAPARMQIVRAGGVVLHAFDTADRGVE